MLEDRLIELSEFKVGDYSFSIVEDGEIYVRLEDILEATATSQIIANQILTLKHPPRGYYSLLEIVDMPQVVDSGTLCICPFVEYHGALALLEMAIQERPENFTILAIKEAFMNAYGYKKKDDIKLKKLVTRPWLQKKRN